MTNKCNLRCKGCVAFAHREHRPAARELSAHRLRNIVSEAQQLGVSAILLASGEPLVRKELLTITRYFPSIVFPLITNGTLIDETTDERRGAGIYKRLRGVMEKMRAEGIFFGRSLTITRSNVATITDMNFVKNLVEAGTRLFLLLEYVSFEDGTDDWVLTDEQRSHLRQKTEALRTQFPALFIAIPGDEEQYGGCLAAGRKTGNRGRRPKNRGSSQEQMKSALQTGFLNAAPPEQAHRNHGRF